MFLQVVIAMTSILQDAPPSKLRPNGPMVLCMTSRASAADTRWLGKVQWSQVATSAAPSVPIAAASAAGLVRDFWGDLSMVGSTFMVMNGHEHVQRREVAGSNVFDTFLAPATS